MTPPENPPRIPAMHELLEECTVHGLDSFGREACKAACHAALEFVRQARREGKLEMGVDEAFWQEVRRRLEVVPQLQLGPAINATGVVLHTNLGRAPWPEEAIAAAVRASGAALCEIDRLSGKRGRRDAAVSQLLAQVTGAEAGLPVNNNAATVLLAVSALARGRKVVVARSELVEIGGSYRMPEVIAAAGATMVEVGCTNRVHAKDFAQALQDPAVSMVLRVHPSNYRLQGFVHEVPMATLAELCQQAGVPLVYDLGSGVLVGQDLAGLEQEHPVRHALQEGCDLVTFSGDKLLGGPQAGLIVGAAALVERLRRNMLTRCLRLDKTILAALEATLSIHALGGEAALQRIPALRRLSLSLEELKQRAENLAAKIQSLGGRCQAQVLACAGRVGSGASPTEDLPRYGVCLQHAQAGSEEIAGALRRATPPIFARVQEEGVLLDLRTMADKDVDFLLDFLQNDLDGLL